MKRAGPGGLQIRNLDTAYKLSRVYVFTVPLLLSFKTPHLQARFRTAKVVNTQTNRRRSI